MFGLRRRGKPVIGFKGNKSLVSVRDRKERTDSVGPGAIVVVGSEQASICTAASEEAELKTLLTQPLPCVEIMGCSMIERTLDRLIRAEAEAITVLVACDVDGMESLPTRFADVKLLVVTNICSGVADILKEYSQRGIEHSIIVSGSLYAETDLLDFFYFHRESRQIITRAVDSEGLLDLWAVNCGEAQQSNVADLLTHTKANSPSYFVREYVIRLAHARDLRQFASDVLRGRCAIRPSGTELKPGVWVEEGAEMHRRARIVAPVYVGRGSKICEDALITRFSTVEKGCVVEVGTVIEDSSILANTHVGIWLDVCHAIANGNRLLNLERNVLVEISDPSVMRANGSSRKLAKKVVSLSRRNEGPQIAVNSKKETPAPESWQLGANPIQG
jgi:NDP-sugar pyrophosphorylase family protein